MQACILQKRFAHVFLLFVNESSKRGERSISAVKHCRKRPSDSVVLPARPPRVLYWKRAQAQPNPSTRLKPVNCDDGFRFGETKSILSQSQNRTRARAIVEVIFDSVCDATRDEDHFDEASRAATSTTYRMRCLSTTSRIF